MAEPFLCERHYNIAPVSENLISHVPTPWILTKTRVGIIHRTRTHQQLSRQCVDDVDQELFGVSV